MTFDPILFDIEPIEEGIKCDLMDLEFGPEFPLDQLTDITLVVCDERTRRSIISKTLADGGITRTGQVLVVPVLPADTRGKAGNYVFQMDFIDAEGDAIATARGRVTINAEINPS